MSEDYIYAVTRVHARETGLLGKNDLERLLACPDEKACLQVLQDKGWGTGEPSPTAEGLLAAEEAKTWDFLQEVAKDPAPLAPLLVPIDGNNLKAAIKCAATGTQPQGVFLPGGQWEPDSLLEMAKARDFSPCPRPSPRRRRRPAGPCSKRGTASCATCWWTGRAWRKSCGWGRRAA